MLNRDRRPDDGPPPSPISPEDLNGILGGLEALGEVFGGQLRALQHEGYTRDEAALIVIAFNQQSAASAWIEAAEAWGRNPGKGRK